MILGKYSDHLTQNFSQKVLKNVLEHGNSSGLSAHVVVDTVGTGDEETASRIKHRMDFDDRHASVSGGTAVRPVWNQSRSETGVI